MIDEYGEIEFMLEQGFDDDNDAEMIINETLEFITVNDDGMFCFWFLFGA